MKIEILKITELTPDPNNARTHDEANLKAIEGSLREFGQRKPIVIDQHQVIVAGNGTVEAAKRLGWDSIEAVRIPADWNADQIKAFALADNRTAELAAWNPQVMSSQLLELQEAGFEIEALGFELPEPIINPDEIVEDEVPESAPNRVALGDIWRLGKHRLMCGDSTSKTAIDFLLANAVIDMVFTDPPYGINHSGKGITAPTKSGKIVDGNDFGEILGDGDVRVAIDSFQLSQQMFPELTQIWWGANYYSQSIPNGYGWLIWDKERVGDIFSGAEIAFVNKGIKVNVFRHMWHGIAKASEQGQKRIHPTQKPIALVDYCFSKYGDPKTVLDLFGGSGSTLIACEQTDRTCYMMELDPKYCDVIIQRWENLTGQKAELVNDGR
jgi:DNA modification methylase